MINEDGFKVCTEVQFYQVDSMHVVHHSQYLYYLEEARFRFAEEVLGLHSQDLKEYGFYLPVVNLHCRYIKSATLGEKLCVMLKISKNDLNGMVFYYKVKSLKDNRDILYATTEHIFTNVNHELMLDMPKKWLEVWDKIQNQNYIVTEAEIKKYRRKHIV